MKPMHQKYKNVVDFLVIYTLEAHPVGSKSPYSDDEWVPWVNRVFNVDVEQPVDLRSRIEQASLAKRVMESNAEFLVDGIGNDAWKYFGKAPPSAYIVSPDG